MIIDKRSFPYSVNAQLVIEPLVQIGVSSSNNIPEFACYNTPDYKIIKTTKVLWLDEEDYLHYFERAMANANEYSGTNIITNATISDSYIFLDGIKRYSGTIQYTTFPSLGTFYTPTEEVITKKINVIGFTATGKAIWGDAYKGRDISIKSTISGSASSSGSSNGMIKKETKSNYRYVNGTLYYDLSEEIQELD